RDLLARSNVPNGDLGSVAGTYRVRFTRVIDVLGNVPAQDAVATLVDVGVLIGERLDRLRQCSKCRRRYVNFERVLNVNEGSFWDESGGENTITKCRANVPQRGVGMNYLVPSVTVELRDSGQRVPAVSEHISERGYYSDRTRINAPSFYTIVQTFFAR